MQKITAALMASLCLLAACNEEKSDVRPEHVNGVVNKFERAEALQGKWTGPEGTFLNIEKNGGGFVVVIQNLDGPRSFAATPTDDGLTFTRDGKKETITVGDGQDTGMKWLADKFDCVVVNPGEGFCRD